MPAATSASPIRSSCRCSSAGKVGQATGEERRARGLRFLAGGMSARPPSTRRFALLPGRSPQPADPSRGYAPRTRVVANGGVTERAPLGSHWVRKRVAAIGKRRPEGTADADPGRHSHGNDGGLGKLLLPDHRGGGADAARHPLGALARAGRVRMPSAEWPRSYAPTTPEVGTTMDDRKSTHRPRRLPAAVALAALGTPLIAASPALADGHGGPHADSSGSAAEATSASGATAGANVPATGGAAAGGNEQSGLAARS